MPRQLKIDPVDHYVGSRIRQARSLRNIKLYDLGKQINVSQQQMQKYETGVNRVGSSRLYQLSQILLKVRLHNITKF